MAQRRDLTGKCFGKWSVLRLSDTKNSRGYAVWWCQCDCGTIRETTGRLLFTGNSTSCGCNHTKRPYESLYNCYIVNRAAKRNVSSSLTYEEFLEFTKQNACHYCGATVKWQAFSIGKKGSAYNLDRKDNNSGYTKENCVVCCKRCNRGKWNVFTYDEWYKMTKCFREEGKKC